MARDFDARLAEELAADFEGLKEELRKAMSSTVSVTSKDPCPKCDCKHYRVVEVPDYKTKLAIAEWWSNRGFGRPGQALDEAEGERIVFERVVYVTSDEDGV